jgi:hypothetical protein
MAAHGDLCNISLLKMRLLFVLITLTIVFSEYAAGQQGDSSGKANTGKMEISEVVAKPIFEGTNGGNHIRVWIMSVIKASNQDLNDSVADEVKTGTHHIMAEVTDAENKKELPGALVKVLVTFPSKKELSVDLKPMENQYGTNLSLDEKGEYQFNLSVTVNGNETLTPFRYTN